MVGILSIGYFLRNFDKKPLAVAMCVITALSILVFYFIPTDQYLRMIVVNCVGTFIFAPTAAIVWSMYEDVVAYGEYKFGRRSTGLIHSASLFSLKSGHMIAITVVGYLLAWFGYVANIEQTERSLFGIALMFSILPAIVALGKAYAIWRYLLHAVKMAEIETALAERHVANT
ncbi:MAG: MFS transporter [Candidatus Synoicihabitans palmerolidicus]|nr:MFS transporter [Candidatus Synoicihabitans palmerolidicus]